MATFVLTDARIEINSVVLSAWGNSVSLNYEAEAQDDSAFGDTTRQSKGGMKNWSGEIEFFQDYAASAPDVSLFSLVGSQVAIKIRPTSGSISATNPEYQGTALITSYKPIAGSLGEMLKTGVSFVAAGTLTRATS